MSNSGPQVAVFGMKTDGTGCDLIGVDRQIPLGILVARPDTVCISFHSMGQLPVHEYILSDRQTDVVYDLDDDIVIALDASSLGRFVLRKKSDDKELAQNNTEIVIRAREAIVHNVEGINQLQVFNMQGHLISDQSCNGAVQSKASLRQGVNLLRVLLCNGQYQTFKFSVP